MRRLTASFFLLVYLFANTELHEVAKLGAFVTHYAEHRQEDKDLTLGEFVKIHYFNGNLIDADYAKDMELPFKAPDCSNSTPTHTIPAPVFLTLNKDVIIKTARLPLYDQTALPSLHVADIWQPPKAC